MPPLSDIFRSTGLSSVAIAGIQRVSGQPKLLLALSAPPHCQSSPVALDKHVILSHAQAPAAKPVVTLQLTIVISQSTGLDT